MDWPRRIRTFIAVGLEETDDGIRTIYLNTVFIATLDERNYTIRGSPNVLPMLDTCVTCLRLLIPKTSVPRPARRTPSWRDCSTSQCVLFDVQVLRSLTTPRLRDDRLELSGGHRRQAKQDRRETIVVRLGEELRRVQGQQDFLVIEARDPYCDDTRLRHARLPKVETLHPDPDEALPFAPVTNREGEVVGRFLGFGQR